MDGTGDVSVAPAGGADRTTHFDCFDGLRAIAALLVLVFHTTRAFPPPWMPEAGWRLVDRLGPFGVCVFFLISGFLLYRPFATAALGGRPAPHLVDFWLRRAFRIFPAYWLVLIVATWGMHVVSIRSGSDAVTYFGLLQNYRQGLTFAGLSVAWTLVIEVSFYAVLPLLAVVLRALAGCDETRRATRLLVAVVGLFVIGLAARSWSHELLAGTPKVTGRWLTTDQIFVTIVGYLDWFALGMFLAVASLVSAGHRAVAPLRALARVPGAAWGVALLAYVIAAALDVVPGELAPVSGGEAIVLSTALGIAAFCLLIPAVFELDGGGGVRRFLRLGPVVYLGTIAYGIYLWHVPFKNLVLRWTRHGTIPDAFALQLLLVLGLTIAVASLSYAFLERPLIRFSRRITRGAKTARS